MLPGEVGGAGQGAGGLDAGVALVVDDPRGVTADVVGHAWGRERASATAGTALDVGEPLCRRFEQGLLFLAAGTPVGAVELGPRVAQVDGQGLKLRVLRPRGFVEDPAVVQVESADDEHGDDHGFFQRG